MNARGRGRLDRRTAGALAVLAAVGSGTQVLSGLHADAAGVRSAIETAIVLSTLLAAFLLQARFKQTRLLRDLLLLSGLTTLGFTDFIFNALPAYAGNETGTHGLGARLTLTVLVTTSSFLAMAFAPTRRRVAPGSRIAMLAVPAGLLVVTLGDVVDLIARPATAGALPTISTAFAVAGFCGLVIAGGRFVLGSRDRPAEAGFLAGAAVLLAGASLQKLALPRVPSEWVTPADLSRLTAYALLLATAVLLYQRTREQIARDAIAAERVRIARDLHDGIAQDLAFIAAHSDRLAADWGSEHPLAVAAQRALSVSRLQIVDLEASDAPTLESALREVSAELAVRFGVDIRFTAELGSDLDVSRSERTELVRIAREAIANAVRHGQARHIDLVLGSRRSDVLLRVIDDGGGMTSPLARANRGTGLGMRTMRARARILGSELIADSRDGGGTEITVAASASQSRAA